MKMSLKYYYQLLVFRCLDYIISEKQLLCYGYSSIHISIQSLREGHCIGSQLASHSERSRSLLV